MKKLLHIIDSLAVGGAEKLLVGIINGLEGYEHHLIILKTPESLRSQIKVDYKFKNLHCHSFWSLFRKIGIVNKYIREHKIDIVHSHLYESNLLARLATPRKVPLVNSIHAITSLAAYKVNKMSLYLERLSYKKRHILVAVSKAVLNDFAKWNGVKGRHYVLYNFIENKFLLPHTIQKSARKGLKLVAVGNLRYQKNYPYLLNAFKNIKNDVHLDIYGEGSLREVLQKDIDTFQLNIKLCGIHNDMEKILPDYDAFVMSSFYEGQPVSLLEAIACGLPPILADIPVLREVAGNDAAYFNIDDTDSFVNVVNSMMAGQYNLQTFSIANYKKINEFAHQQQYMSKLSGIYEETLASYNLEVSAK